MLENNLAILQSFGFVFVVLSVPQTTILDGSTFLAKKKKNNNNGKSNNNNEKTFAHCTHCWAYVVVDSISWTFAIYINVFVGGHTIRKHARAIGHPV